MQKYGLYLILIFFSIALITYNILASPISVPVDHWSYQFIERFQTKGILRDFLSSIKPYSRDEMAGMIMYISNMIESGKVSLNKIEKEQFEMMKREFAQELTDLGMVGIKKYKHLVDWIGNEKRFTAEAGYTQNAISKKGTEDHSIYKGALQVILYGVLKNSLYFYIGSRGSYTHSNESLPLRNTYISFGYPWEGSSDSYMIFRFPWSDIELGKNSILWGTGYDGVIGLSGVNPSFDFIKLPLKFWKIKYVNILGFPLDDIPVGSKSEIVSKYLSAHRIELQPFSGVCIGWQEAYIYYEKLYPQLINPVMPYGMAHVYMGDVGNYATEGDIEFCALPNTKLYASLFLDDLHYLENPFTYAGNKWAALGGILIVDPFRLENLDFRAEYARIEPWAYTHAGITNEPSVPTSYKNSDSLLGHWIGANADDMFFEINRWLSRDLQIALSYRRIRKGEIGGSIYEYDASVNNGGKKRFLEGVIEKEHNISLDLKYRILDDSKIEIKCSHIKMHNKQNEEAKLPPYDKRKQPWKSGNNWSQNTVEVSVSLEY